MLVLIKADCHYGTILGMSKVNARKGDAAMKTINFEKYVSNCSRRSCLQLLVCIFCLLLNNSSRADECMLAKQLHDPYVRAEYAAVLTENRTNGLSQDVDEFYGKIETVSFPEIPGLSGRNIDAILDPISMECLACHDGVLAREAKHRVFNGNWQRVKSIETILGAHPIGMDYDQYRWRKEYVPVEMLPADMVLMNGKVTCVTCHNLLGKTRKYLAVDNDKSRLCFSCHIK